MAVAALVTAVMLVLLAGSFAAAVLLARPDREAIPLAPAAIPAIPVEFPSASGSRIRGWLTMGRQGQGAILALHGVRANRLAMLDRHRFLVAAGYTVLSIDFQAHGESTGDHVTYGYLESRDVTAALAFLRTRAVGERVGVIGISMGGAAALLASPRIDVDAIVLEQVYTTIDDALDNRMRLYLGAVGAFVEPLLAWTTQVYLGIERSRLRPVDRIGSVHVPMLIVGGGADRRVTLAQTRRLYAAAHAPKELWIVPGAAHDDLARRMGERYRARILEFMARYVRVRGTDTASHSR